MKIHDLIKLSNNKLSKLENPQLNTRLLLEEFLNIPPFQLMFHYDKEIPQEEVTKICKWIERRANNEPLQYIFGYTEFFNLSLKVSSSVLIPRPETEYLIEIIKEKIGKTKIKRILDIGTGTGAIALSLKKIFPDAQVVATDISKEALEIAKYNSRKNNLLVDFYNVDIYDENLGKFDLVVSNPPYINDHDYEILPTEVKKFEPKLALHATNNGLFFYEKILSLKNRMLNKNGVFFFEIGEAQALSIKELAKKYNLDYINIVQDLVGKDRIVIIKEQY